MFDDASPAEANLLDVGVHLEALTPEGLHLGVEVEADAGQGVILVRVDLRLEHHIGVIQRLDQRHRVLHVHVVCW